MNTIAFTTDHPAWTTDSEQHARIVLHQGEPWIIACDGVELHRHSLTDNAVEAPPIGCTFAADLPEHPEAAPLVAELATLGTVARVPNPWLWDAITTAVLRQVVRAEQARKVYRRWCATYGRTLETPVGALSLAPDPTAVLGLPDEAFAATGTRFHRTALRAAASAYSLRHEEWEQLPADDLVKALEEVERIGPWTASAAVADYTGDFSVYPHGDLAVRTWARRAAPGLPLPEGDRAFAAQWRRWTDNDRTRLHTLTLFALTWGSHVRTAHTAPPD